MELVDNAMAFVEDNKTTIIIAVAVSVVVLAAWLYFRK